MSDYYTISFYDKCDFVESHGISKKKFLPFKDSELFEGIIRDAKLLTPYCENSTIPCVYQFKIDLPKDCSRIYQAGDTVGIFPKNDEKEVCEILHRLDLGDKMDEFVEIKGPKIPTHVPERGCTLKDIFINCFDLRSVPSKMFLKSLAAQTNDTTEIERINAICQHKYSKFVYGDGKTLKRLLNSFPRCQPTLATLIKFLPPLKPRPYSISTAFSAEELKIVFAIQHGRKFRKGICSGYLEKCCQKTAGVPPIIQFYYRKPTDFRLPADPDQNIIMIATGAGIAPFMGFIEERACAQSRGGAYLYYGCRYQERDFLFKAELQKYQEKGVLTELHTSFSRDAPKKIYIQERIKETWNKLYMLITIDDATVYVCGAAKTMMTDVRRTFVELLRMSAGLSDEKQAEDMLKTMQQNKKYIEDQWI